MWPAARINDTVYKNSIKGDHARTYPASGTDFAVDQGMDENQRGAAYACRNCAATGFSFGQCRRSAPQGAGILDGDLLAVHRCAAAANGQVVVARLDDEVTVKRLRRRGHIVELLPENPDFSPLVVDLRRRGLVIEGIGVGVIRRGKAL